MARLKDNIELRELYLTGNPCETHWEAGCRDYVIATLPQLTHFDGKEISKSDAHQGAGSGSGLGSG